MNISQMTISTVKQNLRLCDEVDMIFDELSQYNNEEKVEEIRFHKTLFQRKLSYLTGVLPDKPRLLLGALNKAISENKNTDSGRVRGKSFLSRLDQAGRDGNRLGYQLDYAGESAATRTSVFERSSPLKSKGIRSRIAKAYEKQSPKLSPAGCRPLPKRR